MNMWESISQALDETASNQHMGLLLFVLVYLLSKAESMELLGASCDLGGSAEPLPPAEGGPPSIGVVAPIGYLGAPTHHWWVQRSM